MPDNDRMLEGPQLQMLWPKNRRADCVEPDAALGYRIRLYHPGDEQAFLDLMDKTDFDRWDEQKLRENMAKILPGGWFFAVEADSDHVVATAMCLHNYMERSPFTGDIGWVACDPNHRGHGLGFFLTGCATARLLSAGYDRIQLHTEAHRLPAIRTYLKLGYLPVLDSPEVCRLWEKVCRMLGWPFTPDEWFEHPPWQGRETRPGGTAE